MKVGRPSKRMEMHRKILEVINSSQVPLTALKISRQINANWGTVKKYLTELCALGMISFTEINSGKKKIRLYVAKR